MLPLTLDLGPAVWRVLDKCHNIRNLGEYEGDLSVDERIVTDLVATCQAVAERVDALSPLVRIPMIVTTHSGHRDHLDF